MYARVHAHARAGAGAHVRTRTYIPHSRACHCENVNNENAYIYTSQKRKRLHVKAFTLSTSFDKFQQIDVEMSNESAYFRQISQNRQTSAFSLFRVLLYPNALKRLKTA